MDNQKRTENAIDRAEAMTKMLAENVKSDEEDIYIKVSAVVQLLRELSSVNSQHSGDLISREKTLTAFADYVGSGMSMDDYDALWDIVVKMPAVKQEPRFIAKSDGTIEQIKECTEQEPCDKCVYSTKDGDCQYDDVTETIPPFEPCGDAISREHTLAEFKRLYFDDKTVIRCAELVLKNEPPVNPQEPKTGHWIEDARAYYEELKKKRFRR